MPQTLSKRIHALAPPSLIRSRHIDARPRALRREASESRNIAAHWTEVAAPLGGVRKRAFDLAGALFLLAAAAPLFVLLFLAVRLAGGGPALFRHTRIGFDGAPFVCLKFRTMVMNADAVLLTHLAANPAAAEEWRRDQKLRRDPRVTWIGAFLRKTSLDELPQLFNVLRGEMSLVGPRPIVEAELPRYGVFRRAYLAARPGMTGLWQVSGRNSTTYARRTHLDAAYVRRWRLRNDVAILLKTLPEVLRPGGAF